jgi:hypothetical protein
MMGFNMLCQKFIALNAHDIIATRPLQTVATQMIRDAACSKRTIAHLVVSVAALEQLFQLPSIFLEDFFRRLRRRAFAPFDLIALWCGLRADPGVVVSGEKIAHIVPIKPQQKSDEPDNERDQQKQQKCAQAVFLGLLLSRHDERITDLLLSRPPPGWRREAKELNCVWKAYTPDQ